MNPKFINSTKYSFLQKLKAAYDQLQDQYVNCSFTLYSPFDIDQDDVLYSAVNNIDGFINLDKIFDGTKITQRAKDISAMMNHLSVDEEELKKILGQLKFFRGQRFDELVDQVNFYLEINSFQRISTASAQNPYIMMASKWLSGNISEITIEFIHQECLAEGLFGSAIQNASKIAIKTFTNGTNYLKEQCIVTLDLSDFFDDGKYIKQDTTYEAIIEKIQDFSKIQDITKLYEIHLPCSLSIGFLTGRIFNAKSGISIYPIQKTAQGFKQWNYSEKPNTEPMEDIIRSEIIESTDLTLDNILAISITHDIKNDVSEYIKLLGLKYSRQYFISHTSIGQYAVSDGQQCSKIAEYIASILNRRSRSEKMRMLHVFISAPVSLMFYLGKYSLNFGKLQFYEHDMEYRHEEAYCKSIAF